MADVTKEIALEVSLKDSTGAGTQSAKQRLREMQKELLAMAEAGNEGTEAFRKLEREAGKLKDEIGDVNQRIKNLASDTKTIDAFVGAVQGITAGFQIAQGAAALFGDENEDLQKALLKVQGAMALANGVQQVANLLQKESAVMMALNTNAQKLYALAVGTSTGALRAFRIALAATGIGAIVVVLGLAAEAMGLFGSETKEATKDQEALKKAANETVGTLEYYERKRKAFGATEKELAEERKKTLEDELRNVQANYEHAVKLDGKRNDSYQNAARARIDVLKTEIREQQNIIDKANKDEAAENKAAADRNKAKSDQRIKQQQAENEKLADLRNKYREELLHWEFELNTLRQEGLQAAEDKRLQTIEDGMKKEAKARMTATARDVERDKVVKAAEIQREEELARVKQQMADQSFSIIGDIITATAGKSEEAQRKAFNAAKVASIAQALVNTYLGVTSALAMTKELFPGQRFVQAGLTLAAGLANVAKIRSTQFQGGGGGGSAPAPSGDGGTTTATPAATFSNPNTTMLGNQGQPVPQPQGTQPMRAYVVERDIQQTTSRVRQLSEFATLGS